MPTGRPRTPEPDGDEDEDDQPFPDPQSPSISARFVSKAVSKIGQLNSSVSPTKKRPLKDAVKLTNQSPKRILHSNHEGVTAVKKSSSFYDITSANTSFASTVFSPKSSFECVPDGVITANTSFSSINSATAMPPEVKSFNSERKLRSDSSKPNAKRPNHAVENLQPYINSNSHRQQEQHQVTSFPSENIFFMLDIQSNANLGAGPFVARWELSRVAVANDQILDQIPLHCFASGDRDAFEKLIRDKYQKIPKASSSSSWAAAANSYAGFSFKVTLSFNPNNVGPLFTPHIEAIEAESSCRFQRKFGSDRFIFLSFPQNQGLPYHLSKQKSNIKVRFQEWLQVEHRFLGRTWRAFHYEIKKPKRANKIKTEDMRMRVVLFATSGYDILPKERFNRAENKSLSYSQHPEMNIQELLDWFMPMEANADMKLCKAFARLDLGLSKTSATLVVKPSQRRFVEDTCSDGAFECSKFNDPAFEFKYPLDPSRVMNDGCARISVALAKKVWFSMNMPGHLPSAFQGRIGGAKGVWIVSGPSSSQETEDLDEWIEITTSQQKFKPHPEDLDDTTFDAHRMAFEVLKTSAFPSKAGLHTAFLPILVDRGVPRENIIDMVQDSLLFEENLILSLLDQPIRLRRWLRDEISRSEGTSRSSSVQWQAGLPLARIEKAMLLLEAGFSPKECRYLGELVHKLLGSHMIRTALKLSLRVSKSVNVLGIADPLGVLKPGEIHLGFSKYFVDDETSDSYLRLQDVDVLVGRHPATRSSDIQKVRAVFKVELSYLVDVVVFPSRGQYPLAGKLGGGDYDGDTFFVFWDPRLTQGFRNAPAPVEAPKPEHYGIRVDRRTIGDLPKSKSGQISSRKFLQNAFAFRFEEDLLGQCTNFSENLSYQEGRISSPEMDALADIRDLLVDSAKNGYVFGSAEFNEFKERLGLKNKNPPRPSHQEAMKRLSELARTRKKFTSLRKTLEEVPKHKSKDINDCVFFELMVPHMERTMQRTVDALSVGGANSSPGKTLSPPDIDLCRPYEELKATGEADLVNEFRALENALDEIRKLWTTSLNKNGDFENADLFNKTLESCYVQYRQIQPRNAKHPRWQRVISEATIRRPSEWELIKASALYCGHHARSNGTFVFHIAGGELCYIKAHSVDGTRFMTEPMWRNSKPARIRSNGDEEMAVSRTGAEREQEFQIADEVDGFSGSDDDSDFFEDLRGF